MADKEVKAFLKEAREQIKNKDFKSALKECKKVLNKDKNNYMALVFCGLCLSELDQPDQALQVNFKGSLQKKRKKSGFFPKWVFVGWKVIFRVKLEKIFSP